MMINYYSLNLTLLRALAKIARRPGIPARECGMTKGEYANYTKLKYWQFIRKLEDGIWIVTSDGKEFLKGNLRVAKKLGYFRDKVVEREGITTSRDILPNEESKQKYREMMEPVFGPIWSQGVFGGL